MRKQISTIKEGSKKSDYVIKFYDGGTLLTSWSHTKSESLKEFKRVGGLPVQKLNRELGLNSDLSVSDIYLQDYEGKEIDAIKVED